MSLTQNRWFRRFGFAVIAALSLGASAMMTNPAQAHEFGYRAPVVAMHRAAYVPRLFFGHGWGYGGYYWHHGDHRWR
jgi:hypothetical protein